MGTPPGVITRGREYRLFDADAVGLAAFICSPLAGTILMAVNYVRLGKIGKGVVAVMLGLIATTVTILIKSNLSKPSGSLGSLVLVTLFLICTWQIAKNVQGKAVEEHTTRGGQLGSKSAAFGVGIATLVGLVVVTGAVVNLYQYRKIVVIGTRDQG